MINSPVHRFGTVELDHPSLGIPANEPLFELPWLGVFQILIVVLVLHFLVRGWADTFFRNVVRVRGYFRIRHFTLNGDHIAKR